MRVFLAGLACGALSGFLTYNDTHDTGAAAVVGIIVTLLAWLGIAYAVIDLGD
ncbi:hypothetical protein AB0H51_28275 [Streptomyces griseoluteus]|uniref:hypothetical protein n=1 Tax=Streptomyces griseoluteus TaxID=29306 RepID=UPI0033F51C31